MSTAAPAAGEASAATAPAAATDPALQSTALRAVTPAPAVPRCDNCGANVPGRFCGTCGQRLEPPIHSLWHFIGVATEDVTHADSRLWRTLAALLFMPGFLTREFLQGRRARYLPPVRLYLVLSVVFFVWVAATGNTPDEAHITPATRGAIADARQAVATAGPQARYSGSTLEGEQEHCKLIGYNGPWKSTIQPALARSCMKASEDHGRSLGQSILHNLPRAMFLFLPLLAGVLMLLYWRPRHYYVEHLLFCLHNHAFAFLVVLLAGIVSLLLPFAATLIGWVTTLYVVWYLYRSMRVMYGQGRLRTVAKLGVLSFMYLVVGSFMVVATTLYALMTL
ncbi:MAG: DUF3667 domain-containing protein [Steroidobacteraceae bacterium]